MLSTEGPTASGSAPRSAVIIGAGIVGASLAHALRSRGVDVRIVAGNGAKASDVPVAIAQPVMGRHASASPLRVGAWRHACRLIEDVAPDAVLSRGLLRFTTDEKTATRWRDRCAVLSVTVASWYPAARCLDLVPRLTPETCGGIWIPDALALDLERVVRGLLEGVPLVRGDVQAMERTEHGASVKLSDETVLTADVVIVAAGTGTAGLLDAFDPTLELPWRGTLAGEVVRARATAPESMVGERGQIVPLGAGIVSLTASQRPDGQATDADEASVAELLQRYAQTLPENAAPVVLETWVGQRATTLDAHPIVGPIDDDRRFWVCSGMGSRGVIFGTFASEKLAAELCGDNSVIPAEWGPFRRAVRHPGRPALG
ncbi:MAG: glycine/D-amino acid oxidase-like deaminating enzyme [Bradymonadia bacterium]|jgi:glycine/D-amino acid oxidase-like deaminating enzyme